KSKKLAKVPTTLASIESLTFPLVHEVVLLADYRCTMCQDRVADIVSRLNVHDNYFAFDHYISKWLNGAEMLWTYGKRKKLLQKTMVYRLPPCTKGEQKWVQRIGLLLET
ncbi:hypothetical protein Tco_1553015, partial [Tanacetum coccineum]